MKKFLISVFVVLLLLAACFYFSLIEHESYSSLEDSFVINKPYLSVVKSLASKESLEKTIEDSNGVLKYKHWSNFTVEVPKRILKLKDYKLEGKLEFAVEKKDESLGKLDLKFEQNVEVDKDVFHVVTNLKSPQENVLLCGKVIEITPIDEFSVNVKIKSEIKIKKLLPYFFKETMDKKVELNNMNDLELLKSNIINMSNNSGPTVQFKRNFE